MFFLKVLVRGPLAVWSYCQAQVGQKKSTSIISSSVAGSSSVPSVLASFPAPGLVWFCSCSMALASGVVCLVLVGVLQWPGFLACGDCSCLLVRLSIMASCGCYHLCGCSFGALGLCSKDLEQCGRSLGVTLSYSGMPS